MSDKLITLANLEAFKTKADALYAKSSDIPTKTSQLTNDSGFLTSSSTVTTNTAQTISGAKTFSSVIQSNAGMTVAIGKDIKFSCNNYPYTQLKATDTTPSSSSPVVINLPRTSGTLALTSDIPSSSGSSQLYCHYIRLYGEDAGGWEAEIYITAYNTIDRAMTEAEVRDYLNNCNSNIFNATGYAYNVNDRIYVSVYRVAYWNDGQDNISFCGAGGEWHLDFMDLCGYVEIGDTFDYEY